MTLTQSDLLTRHDVDVPAHLTDDAEVPVLTGLQAQGDVTILPAEWAQVVTVVPVPVPAAGVAVVRGENGGHTHLLVAEGAVTWAPARDRGADIGVVTVPGGATAWMLHPEHGGSGIGTGSYVIRRQREAAAEATRLVAD